MLTRAGIVGQGLEIVSLSIATAVRGLCVLGFEGSNLKIDRLTIPRPFAAVGVV